MLQGSCAPSIPWECSRNGPRHANLEGYVTIQAFAGSRVRDITSARDCLPPSGTRSWEGRVLQASSPLPHASRTKKLTCTLTMIRHAAYQTDKTLGAQSSRKQEIRTVSRVDFDIHLREEETIGGTSSLPRGLQSENKKITWVDHSAQESRCILSRRRCIVCLMIGCPSLLRFDNKTDCLLRLLARISFSACSFSRSRCFSSASCFRFSAFACTTRGERVRWAE